MERWIALWNVCGTHRDGLAACETELVLRAHVEDDHARWQGRETVPGIGAAGPEGHTGPTAHRRVP
jgi:hypothetical protein